MSSSKALDFWREKEKIDRDGIGIPNSAVKRGGSWIQPSGSKLPFVSSTMASTKWKERQSENEKENVTKVTKDATSVSFSTPPSSSATVISNARSTKELKRTVSSPSVSPASSATDLNPDPEKLRLQEQLQQINNYVARLESDINSKESRIKQQERELQDKLNSEVSKSQKLEKELLDARVELDKLRSKQESANKILAAKLSLSSEPDQMEHDAPSRPRLERTNRIDVVASKSKSVSDISKLSTSSSSLPLPLSPTPPPPPPHVPSIDVEDHDDDSIRERDPRQDTKLISRDSTSPSSSGILKMRSELSVLSPSRPTVSFADDNEIKSSRRLSPTSPELNVAASDKVIQGKKKSGSLLSLVSSSRRMSDVEESKPSKRDLLSPQTAVRPTSASVDENLSVSDIDEESGDEEVENSGIDMASNRNKAVRFKPQRASISADTMSVTINPLLKARSAGSSIQRTSSSEIIGNATLVTTLAPPPPASTKKSTSGTRTVSMAVSRSMKDELKSMEAEEIDKAVGEDAKKRNKFVGKIRSMLRHSLKPGSPALAPDNSLFSWESLDISEESCESLKTEDLLDMLERVNVSKKKGKPESSLSGSKPSSPALRGQQSVFGAPLSQFGETPEILSDSFAFLEEHVSFVPNLFVHIVDEREVNSLKAAMDAGGGMQALQEQDPHVVAHLVLRWFSSLPERLLTVRESPHFIWIQEVENETFRLSLMRSVLWRLPDNNRHVLAFLIKSLRKFCDQPDITQLSSSRLGVVFGPVLLHGSEHGRSSQVVKKFIEDYKRIFMDVEHDIRYQLKDGRQVVRWATVDRLVERLIDPLYKDDTYVETLLMTNEYYVSNADLLAIIVEWYAGCRDPERKTWRNEVARRIVGVLKHWIAKHGERLRSDKEFVEVFSGFVQDRSRNRDPEAAAFRDILEALRNTPPIQATTPPSSPSLSTSSPRFTLFLSRGTDVDGASPSGGGRTLSKRTSTTAAAMMIDIPTDEIAQAITNIDHDALREIRPIELLHKNYTVPDRSPKFHAMVARFNEWGLWAVTEVMSCTNVSDRANTLSQVIEIAHICLEHNNFNACCAIIGGLSNPAVHRLRQTWERVGRKVTSHFEEMAELFNMTNNCKNYRDHIRTKKAPIVPYLALFPKDITPLEEIPTLIEETGAVNFEKMRMLYRIVHDLALFQTTKFGWARNDDLIAKLRKVSTMTDDQAYERSLILEPKEEKK